MSGVIDVHPTAVLDPGVELGSDVVVGPYAVLGPGVVVGARTTIGPHALIERDTTLGEECAIHAGAKLGGDPQDLKYAGEPSQLIVGDRTVVRECATLNRGTAAHGRTVIGSDCLLMAYAHVAHDCVIGDHVVIANGVAMGGHVRIEDWVIVGGLTAIHQFAQIGQHAFVGGSAAVMKDIAPYVKAAGNPLKLYGLNTVGLQRRGFAEDVRRNLRQLYRLFFQSKLNISQALEQARREVRDGPEVAHFLAFVERSERGITV